MKLLALLAAVTVAGASWDWRFHTGSYGCAGQESGECVNCTVSEAESKCEANSCVGLLIESGGEDPCTEPNATARMAFTSCTAAASDGRAVRPPDARPPQAR